MITLRAQHLFLVGYPSWPHQYFGLNKNSNPSLFRTHSYTERKRPPRPPKPRATELSWRARIEDLRNVRPLLRMVWETSPPLVLATVFFRLLRALMPLAALWVPKLILDAVVARITNGSGTLSHIWKLVGLELGLALLNDVLGRANTLCDSLLGDRFTNRISIRLMRSEERRV